MKTKIVEAIGTLNWGKFMLGQFDDERRHPSALEGVNLLRSQGWGPEHLLVVDLATGEGAIFAARPGGLAAADLDKHQIWVCPLFEPFLEWLYQQDLTDLDLLPQAVELLDAPALMYGYRRQRNPDETAPESGSVTT